MSRSEDEGKKTADRAVPRDVGSSADASIASPGIAAVASTDHLPETILQELADFAYAFDRSGRFIFANQTLRKFLRLETTQIVGKNFIDLGFPPELAARLQEEIERVFTAKQPVAGDTPFTGPDGVAGIYEYIFRPVAVVDGSVAVVVGSTRDVTRRVQAENARQRSEEQNSRIIESIGDGFCALDREWRFTYINAEAEKLLGTPRASLLGSVIWARFPGLAGSAFEKVYKRAAEQGEQGVVTAFYPDHQRWYEARVFPAPPGISIYFRDVTEEQRVLDELRVNEERFRALGDQGAMGVCEVNAEGRITMCNERFAEIAGRPVADLIGRTFLEITHEADRERGAAALQKMVETGAPFSIDKRYIRPDGTEAWVHNRVSVLRNRAGAPNGAIAFVLDLTERRRAEEASRASDERLRMMIEGAREYAIFSMDLEMKITSWNSGAERLLGYNEREILGKNMDEIFTAEERATGVPERERQVALAEGRAQDERWSLRKDGTRFWSVGVLMAVRDGRGEPTGFLKIVRDQTEARRVHDALKTSQSELQVALARAQRARADAEAAGLAKDHFLAMLSHELRTPLNPILLLASDASADTALSPQVREVFSTIRKNVQLEARLIDDMLDLTRISRGKISLDKSVVEVHGVLRDALANLNPDVLGKDLQLETQFVNARCMVYADPVRLQQVFSNLLSNAIKFTPRGGKIRLTTVREPERQRVLVTVTDTGIGLTGDETKRVFDAFSQGDHAQAVPTQKFGGLGLGLAIARRLTELHGGKISAESPGPGNGSSFTVDLPLHSGSRPPVGDSEVAAAPTALPPGSLRMLVVEDHAPTRGALRLILLRRGHVVHVASCATEALNLAGQQPFDVVVSDIGLPDMDGFELLPKLRVYQPQLAAIALSGYGMEKDLQRSAEAGYADHLVKPVLPQKLDEAIARLFRNNT